MIERFVFASPRPNMNSQDFIESWINTYCRPVSSFAEIQSIELFRIYVSKEETHASFWNGFAQLSFANREDAQEFLSNPKYCLEIRNDESNWAAIWSVYQLDTELDHCFQRQKQSHSLRKLIVIVKRNWSYSLDDYRCWLNEEFLPFCCAESTLVEYKHFSVLKEEYSVGEPKFDGVLQFTFQSDTAFQKALSASDGILSTISNSGFISETGCCVLPAQQVFSSRRESLDVEGSRLTTSQDSSLWNTRSRTGAMAISEQLRVAGLIGSDDCVAIGNPGSGEELLYLEFGNAIHLGLAEPAVGHIVDGASRLHRRPAIAVAHGFVGFSGLQGAVFNAAQRQSPMLVIVGTADSHAHTSESHMYADVEGAALSARAKYVKHASDPKSLLRDLRDAIVQATIQPYGPVVFIVGSNVASSPNHEEVIAPSFPDTRLSPPTAQIDLLASTFLHASRPAILIGDGVANSCAVEELQVLAELVDADVWASMESQVNFPRNHPLFKGNLGHMDDNRGRELLKDIDLAVAVGTPVYQTVFNSRLPLFSPGTVVATVNLDPASILRGHNDISIPLLGDPKSVLAALIPKIEMQLGKSGTAEAAKKIEKERTEHEQYLAVCRRESLKESGVTMAKVGYELERLMAKLAERPVIFNEALIGAVGLTDHIENVNFVGKYFDTSGGSLGEWAGAVGAAMSGSRTIGIIGDGGFHYAPQALWNAAKLQLPLGLIVANNSSYGLLFDNMKVALRNLGIDSASAPRRHFYELTDIDYVSLAQGYGVPGIRVENESGIADALSQMLQENGPFLIDLVMEPYKS